MRAILTQLKSYIKHIYRHTTYVIIIYDTNTYSSYYLIQISKNGIYLYDFYRECYPYDDLYILNTAYKSSFVKKLCKMYNISSYTLIIIINEAYTYNSYKHHDYDDYCISQIIYAHHDIPYYTHIKGIAYTHYYTCITACHPYNFHMYSPTHCMIYLYNYIIHTNRISLSRQYIDVTHESLWEQLCSFLDQCDMTSVHTYIDNIEDKNEAYIIAGALLQGYNDA
jgi:hypothetical protein